MKQRTQGLSTRARAEQVGLSTGVQLEYLEQGDPSGRTVILLHGYPDSCMSWVRVMSLLPASLHVLAPSQRGYGESDRPQTYSIDDFARDVVAFMDAKRVTSATLVGHSFGTFVAQRTATLAPERVDGLVLLGASAAFAGMGLDEFVESIQTLEDPVPESFARDFMTEVLYRPIPEEDLELYIAENMKLPARVLAAIAAAWPKEERWGDPERMTMPVLVAWGDKDIIMPRSEQDVLAKLPKARLEVWEGTGHGMHWEEPERCAAELVEFVAALGR